jgi:RNA-directed DNA polymerase
VDLDVEKFFNRVNHDILMGRLAKRIEDKRLLRLIRLYLQAGVMVNGVVQERYQGTPQGGPLSPLLSNILLDELDKELERRGHWFCRYADDCNTYVRSKRAGERVLSSIEKFLLKRLKLRVNREKSAVAKPQERSFLGFSFTSGNSPRSRCLPRLLEGSKRGSNRSPGAPVEYLWNR